jgi:Lar family restriction alleviation protein
MADTPDLDALAPCPFCGSESVSIGSFNFGGTEQYYVKCEDCDGAAQGHFDDESALAAWSRRPIVDVEAVAHAIQYEAGLLGIRIDGDPRVALSLAHAAIAAWNRRASSPEARRTARVEEALRKTASALENLHAMVWGECPSLLNEDSGGSAHLDMEIKDALELSRAALAAGQPEEKAG